MYRLLKIVIRGAFSQEVQVVLSRLNRCNINLESYLVVDCRPRYTVVGLLLRWPDSMDHHFFPRCILPLGKMTIQWLLVDGLPFSIAEKLYSALMEVVLDIAAANTLTVLNFTFLHDLL